MKLEDTATANSVGVTSLTDTRQLVTFALGPEEYGIDIAQVQEINRMVEITHVPRAASYMEGVINLRGQLIPVIDLRTRFGMRQTERTRNNRIIVVEAASQRVGLIVDSVSEVVRIPLNQIEPTPDIVTVAHAEFLGGVGKLDNRLIILLNVDQVIGSQAE
jgi:purine-binding chemotaxis protein CheW